MLSRKSSLAILAIVAILLHLNLCSTFEHDLTTHNLTHGDFVQDRDFLASPGLVYGSCRDIVNHNGKFTAKCTFVMETSRPVDSTEHLLSCDYDLNTKVKPNEHLTLKRVVALSENKAVVVFESYDTYRYFVLHFAYAEDVPCKGFRVEVDRDLKATVFAPQRDKFELVSTEGPHCGNKRCRVIVDSRGHVHEATHDWLFNDRSNLLAVIASPIVERLVVDVHDDIMRLYAADHLGMSRLIKEYYIDGSEDGKYDSRRYVSTTYERVSMCTKNKRTLIICAQYDLSGERTFETEITYTRFSTVKLLKVHNTPNGGLLLVLASCELEHSSVCEEDTFNFYVTKTDSRGRQLGTVRVDKSARVVPEKLHLFENEDEKLCLSHVFNDWRSDDTTVLDVFCFDDEDFRKGYVY